MNALVCIFTFVRVIFICKCTVVPLDLLMTRGQEQMLHSSALSILHSHVVTVHLCVCVYLGAVKQTTDPCTSR